jgi:hypothetical protein
MLEGRVYRRGNVSIGYGDEVVSQAESLSRNRSLGVIVEVVDGPCFKNLGRSYKKSAPPRSSVCHWDC